MDIVAQNAKKNKRYLPHEVSTREGAVKLYRQTKDISFVCRRFNNQACNKGYNGFKRLELKNLLRVSRKWFYPVRKNRFN